MSDDDLIDFCSEFRMVEDAIAFLIASAKPFGFQNARQPPPPPPPRRAAPHSRDRRRHRPHRAAPPPLASARPPPKVFARPSTTTWAEFASERIVRPCRFCQCDIHIHKLQKSTVSVCGSADCEANLRRACLHILPCGHACSGIRGETVHFGCAKCSGELCICGDPCVERPSIRLACGHAIHQECARAQYRVASDDGKIVRPRCGFPGCARMPEHESLASEFGHWQRIVAQIDALLPRVIVDEHLELEEDHVNNPASEYFQNPLLFASEKFSFYMCADCQLPYCGGRLACGDEEAHVQYVCKICERKREECARGCTCAKHGEDGMLYKCFFCCEPARWFCFGTTHFCETCHSQWDGTERVRCPECIGAHCMFHGHPKNGSHMKFGFCRLCTSEAVEEEQV